MKFDNMDFHNASIELGVNAFENDYSPLSVGSFEATFAAAPISLA